MKALILAGGRGTRLGTETPKPIVPVGNQPLLLRQIDLLKKAGINEIIFDALIFTEKKSTSMLLLIRPVFALLSAVALAVLFAYSSFTNPTTAAIFATSSCMVVAEREFGP